MSQCPNLDRNLEQCACTYTSCSRRGMCCECVAYHRKSGEVPGCFFTTAGEKLWDRSMSALIKDRG